jgi:dihydrofolate synthase/folylpolyglutamate synthase
MRYQPSVEARIAAVARAAGARVSPAGESWFWAVEGDHLAYRDAADRVDTPLPRLTGAHQPGNLALAIAMLRHQNALAIPPEAMAAAATSATWPARMQRLQDGPLTRLLPAGSEIWLDGGHNPAAGAAISQSLASVLELSAPERGTKKAILIFGMLANKEPKGLLAPIAPLADRLIAVPVPGHEHHRPDMLARIASNLGLAASTAENVSAALRTIADAGDGQPATVLILGTLYMAGQVLSANDEAPT